MKSNDLSLVRFLLDGAPVDALEGETILQAARRVGTEIPHLCYKDGYRADGNCRACVVEIAGERVLAPSCCRTVTAGMDVKVGSPRARKSQQMVLELLLADMPDQGYKWNDAGLAGVPPPRPSPKGGGGKTELPPQLFPERREAALPLPLAGEGRGEGAFLPTPL
ncbi:MAG TPA: 2Fe-2S iron-sulfur cluster-binding protein, partial [Ramlibacter sp.]|nr:2Fe-2S iron-sulfur cluster-binding protein [Ramlibacter sp.]